jgi:hypothetical protein
MVGRKKGMERKVGAGRIVGGQTAPKIHPQAEGVVWTFRLPQRKEEGD